ncbi:MAG: O-antigen ligase family protein [Cryomorphaceae bacterium]
MRWFNRIEQTLVFALAGFLFWPNIVSSILLIALVVVRILRSGKDALPTKLEWWLTTPAALIVAAWLLHGAEAEGVAEVQLWATWIGAMVYFKSSPFRSFFKQSLVIASLLQAACILIVFGLGGIEINESFSQDFRDQMGVLFRVHPTYVSAVWFWAGLWLVYEERWRLRYRIVGIAALVITASLMGGKMPFLAFTIALTLVVFLRVSIVRLRLALIGTLMLVAALNAMFNPGISGRFNELLKPDISNTENHWLTSTELRLGVWDCAASVAKDHWSFGLGTGATRPALEACFKEYENHQYFATEFNSHNQYIHFWLVGGVFCFLSFLGFLGWLWYEAIKRKRSALLGTLLFVCLLLMTENYFSRQAGMMFISFSIFSLHYRSQVDVRSTPSSVSM